LQSCGLSGLRRGVVIILKTQNFSLNSKNNVKIYLLWKKVCIFEERKNDWNKCEFRDFSAAGLEKIIKKTIKYLFIIIKI
jgi:hypothetical protein